MDTLFTVLIIATIVSFLYWVWSKKIDQVMEDYPDYSREDMLDEKPKQDWDDNKQHTEQNV